MACQVEWEVTKEQIPRWPLAKNEFDLSDHQQAQLADICWRDLNVAHFHWVKEQLTDLYGVPKQEEIRADSAKGDLELPGRFRCRPGSVRAHLQTWKDPILAFHQPRVTNSYTEGVQAKV